MFPIQRLQEDVAHVDCGLVAPVRSVSIAELGGLQYLFVGTSDGNLLYFMLHIMECAEGNVKIMQSYADGASPRNYSFEEEQRCMYFRSLNSEIPVNHANKRYKIVVSEREFIKVGGSEVSFLVGRFCGPPGSDENGCTSMTMDSVLVKTNDNAVLLFGGKETLQAYAVHGATNLFTSTARIHTEKFPFSLVSVSRNAQLLFSHLDVMPRLCWESMHLTGTPSQLAYHKKSKCAIVSCLSNEAAHILFIQIQSMCHVLTVDLEAHHHPTFLGVVHLPGPEKVKMANECVIVSSYTQNSSVGVLSIFSYESFSPRKQQMQYEIHLLGRCTTEMPFQCHCLLQGNTENTSIAEHIAHHNFMNSHGNPFTKSKGKSLLALGGYGKVHIYSVSLRTGSSWRDKELQEKTWISDIERIVEFASPGKSNVTALATISLGTLIVVEELYGISIFQIQESAIMTLLAVHLFQNPIQAMIPMTDTFILLAVYSEGLKLMQRKKEEELAYQMERTRMEEMERARAEQSEHTRSVGRTHTSDNVRKTMALNLPGLNYCATSGLPFTASKLFLGNLGVPIPFPSSIFHESSFKGEQCVVVVTPSGEIGTVTLECN